MSQKETIPSQFKAREPSDNLTDESGTLVRFVPLYGEAIGNYLKGINRRKKINDQTAQRQANQAMLRLDQMIEQYKQTASAQGIYAGLEQTADWPIYDMTEYKLSNLYAKPGSQSQSFAFHVPKSMAAALYQVICPPTNTGVMYQTAESRVCFEIIGVDENKHGYTVNLYAYHILPRAIIMSDGLIQQKTSKNPKDMTLTHVGTYHIYLATDQDSITMTNFHIDCLKTIQPQDIYMTLKPKMLRWSRTEVRLWEDTVIQAYADFDEVFRRRKMPIDIIFAYFYLNIILMTNLSDIQQEKSGDYVLTAPVPTKQASQITLRQACHIIEDMEHLTPVTSTLTKLTATPEQPPQQDTQQISEQDRIGLIQNDFRYAEQLFEKATHTNTSYGNWFKERDTNA